MEVICQYCNSENVYFSKKKQRYVCEDCEQSFDLEQEAFVPQKVFLSYGHDENAEVVEIIYKHLKERGHSPWIDKAEIKAGNDWRDKITQGIIESNDFLAFLSQYSVRVPGVCLDEISIGVSNYNCRVSSILLEKGVVPPNSVSGIQWLDMSDWREVRDNSSEQVWNKYIEDKMKIIFDIVEDKKNIIISGNIAELQKVLQPLTYSLKMRMLLKDGIVMRKWLIDIIREEEKRRAVIICGTPGTGKSVLSAYLCNFATECVASFFCEWNNSDTKKVRKMLYSIIFQMACTVEDYQFRLIGLMKERSMQDMSEDEVLNELLLTPLNYLLDGGREHKFIIFDAIDEVVDDNEGILEIIIRMIDGMPSWIRTIITTRPEAIILEKMQMYRVVNMDSYKDKMSKDVYEYICRNISEEAMAKKISEKCGSSFLYAREMIRLYEENRLDLDALPAEIDGIYYAYFNRIFADDGVYQNCYKPVFELLLSAKEQITVKEIATVLEKESDEIQRILRKVSSYVMEVPSGSRKVLQIFHKSFQEWLISEQAGKYRVLLSAGDERFEEYLIRNIDAKTALSEYFVKHGYSHIRNNVWEELSLEIQEKILDTLLEGTDRYGMLEEEEKYLEIFKGNFGMQSKYYIHALNYCKKVSGSRLLELTEQAAELIKQLSENEQECFELICQIAFAYFYCGCAEKSYELITNEREKHGEDFWQWGDNEACYWHVIAVSAHDLDNNEMVKTAAKRDIEAYKKRRKFYDQYISMINLFDAHMALGELQEADEIAANVFELSENRYYVHVDDILQICYANLLQTEGRIMEALEYYESGLYKAKEIQAWDYLYGSVWRELAIAKFGDKSCLTALKKYRELSREAGYDYLVSLANCFYIVSAYYLGEDCPDETEICAEIEKIGMPGHILQARLAGMLKGTMELDMMQIIPLLDKCEGVKGNPVLVRDFKDCFEHRIEASELAVLKAWEEKYVQPIVRYQEAFHRGNTEGLSETPVLGEFICHKCQAKCCYDGVYITEEEEKRIHDFVAKYPEYFEQLRRPYIVNGDWPGMRSMRKTEKAEYEGYDETFPKHFTKTRCVFALPSGECSLQRIATDLQLHPWRVKPRACWEFPIRGVCGNDIMEPASDRDEDPDYVDENYPGYATFLPCAVVDDIGGKVWYDKYKYEVEYYRYLIREKRI